MNHLFEMTVGFSIFLSMGFSVYYAKSLKPKDILGRGGAPFLEVLQYQVDAWSGRSKLLFQLPAPKIHLIYCPRIEDVSDIKLIRTDTTLDLSQKAEKRYRGTARRCHRPAVLHIALRVTRVPLTPGFPSLASLTVLWRHYTRRSSRS